MATIIEVELAFEFVSGATKHTNRAVYDKQSDCVYFKSDILGEDEIPEDLDWEHCVDIPHKNELDLGQSLVFEFVDQNLPESSETVRDFFRRRGAYSRLKDFLERQRLLDAWYAFENDAQRSALTQWCQENGIPLESDSLPSAPSPKVEC
jgi:hypothetical protein